MIKNFRKKLLLLLIFSLILNFNHVTYAQKDSIVTPSGLSKSELHNSIESFVEEHKDTTAGVAISVFNDKEELYLGHHGYADLENKVLISEDTVFEWGSVSKLLIWVSIFQLWEQDKIDLNEDIRAYLPEDFLKKANKNEKITMLNLMHHDGGWQETVVDLFVEDRKDVKNLKETLQKTEPEQVYPVGKYTAYSNWGSTLAAYIVQEITGQKYYEYVHKNIFKPLNMYNTALLPDLSDNQWVQEKRKEIKGYTSKNKVIEKDFYHIVLYPSGMVTGTLEDLEKFGKGLISYDGEEKLFKSEKTIDSLLEPTLYYEGTEYPRNGNGFWFEEFKVPALGHGGNTKAFTSYLLIEPRSKTCALVMTNQGNEQIYNNKLIPLIFGKFSPVQSHVLEEERENIDGIYQSGRTMLKGYGSLYSVMTRLMVKEEDNEELKITMLGNSLSGYKFEQSLYNIDNSLSQIYKDNDGSIILSMTHGDFYKLKISQIIVDYTLIILGTIAVLYSIVMIILESIFLIKSKIKEKSSSKTFFSKYYLFTLFIIFFGFLNILIMAKKMLDFTILRNIKPHVYISFLFMIILLVYFIFSIFILRKLNLRKRQKIKYILTSIASLVISFNIYYWQLYLIR